MKFPSLRWCVPTIFPQGLQRWFYLGLEINHIFYSGQKSISSGKHGLPFSWRKLLHHPSTVLRSGHLNVWMQCPWTYEMWIRCSWGENEFFCNRKSPTSYKMLCLIGPARPLTLNYTLKIHLIGRTFLSLKPSVKSVPLVAPDSYLYLMLYLISWSQRTALSLLIFFSPGLDWPPIRNVEPWRWSLHPITSLIRFGSEVLTLVAYF